MFWISDCVFWIFDFFDFGFLDFVGGAGRAANIVKHDVFYEAPAANIVKLDVFHASDDKNNRQSAKGKAKEES